MDRSTTILRGRKLWLFGVLIVGALALLGGHFYFYGQDKSGFPEGYDAVQTAPNSHRVIFENAFVRVLEVIVPPPGSTVPMHHHRWPSLVLDWDTGGGSPHVRYLRPDGSVTDIPSKKVAAHPGVWKVQWAEPDPMHSIQVVAMPKSTATLPEGPPELRIEIKTHQ